MATKRKVTKKPPRKPAKRRRTPEDDDLELAEELLRPESPEERAACEREWDKFMKLLGIREKKPIGAKKLRERILKRGLIKPENNEFSRGIIEMREE
jgi:hypothetical protein